MDNLHIPQRTFAERLGKSWSNALIVVVLLITGAIVYKVVTSRLDLDLSNFDFSDFLSLVLATFAIWLSIALYHRGSEVANRFYHEMHAFTSSVSESLGRIEGSFGEALRHIGEKVDRMPVDPVQTTFDIQEMQKEKEALAAAKKELEEQRQKLVDEFAKRASEKQQREHEVMEFARKLEHTMRELDRKEAELQDRQVQLDQLRHELMSREQEMRVPGLRRYSSSGRLAARHIARRLPSSFMLASPDKGMYIMQNVIGNADEELRDVLQSNNMIGKEGKLTDLGHMMISEAYNELRKQGS